MVKVSKSVDCIAFQRGSVYFPLTPSSFYHAAGLAHYSRAVRDFVNK